MTGISRDELQRVLFAENILVRRYFYPGCHRMEPYRSRPQAGSLPETDRFAARVLCLPTGTAVTLRSVREICDILRLVVSEADGVRNRLRRAIGNVET